MYLGFASPPRETSSGIGGCFVAVLMVGVVVLVTAVIVAHIQRDSDIKGSSSSSTKQSTSSNTKSSTSSGTKSTTKRSTSSGSGSNNDPPKKPKLSKKHYDSGIVETALIKCSQ